MKIIVFILPLFIFYSCSENAEVSSTTTEKEEPIVIESETFEELEDVNPSLEEQYAKAFDDSRFSQIPITKTDSSFTLTLYNGSKTFQDHNQDEPDGVEFEFHGLNEKNGLYIVEGHYWEWYEYYLIDKTTGHTDTIWTKPIFSPDNKLLISKSVDWGLEGTPNGYQIWKMLAEHKWIKLIEIDQQKWVPLGFSWISNDTFIMKKAKLSDYAENWDNINDYVIYEKIKVKE